MKTLCLILLIHGSLPLSCDRRQITVHVGSNLLLTCRYDAKSFLPHKKYLCRGHSRINCETLVDSVQFDNTKNRIQVIDLRRRGLYVRVADVRFEDAGVYWVGIDKLYADIMTSVEVTVSEVPASKPRLWASSSLVDRPTCQGQPVIVRCGCERGTGIRYQWYLQGHGKVFLFQEASDLSLHCSALEGDMDFYCKASNDVSSERSDIVSVRVLMTADCVYIVRIPGQPIYDCPNMASATTRSLTTCVATTEIHPDMKNQSSQFNQSTHDLLSRSKAELPLWYTALRWGSFGLSLVSLGLVHRYTQQKSNSKSCTRKTRAHFKEVPHLAW